MATHDLQARSLRTAALGCPRAALLPVPLYVLGWDGVGGRTPVTPPFGRLRGPDHMFTPATHGRTRTRVPEFRSSGVPEFRSSGVPEFRMLLVRRAAGNVVFMRLFGSVWAAEVDLA